MSTKPLELLLLEDNEADAKLIQRAIKHFKPPINVTVVDDRANYVCQIAENKPDIILSDNNLPSFTGDEALLIAKHMACEVPFIFVTGTIKGETNAAQTILKGAAGFVSKDELEKLNDLLFDVLFRQKQVYSMEYSIFALNLEFCLKNVELLLDTVQRYKGLIDTESKTDLQTCSTILKSLVMKQRGR